MPSPVSGYGRGHRHQRRKRDKNIGFDGSRPRTETANIVTRAFRRIRDGWGMILFTFCVCLYLTDFANLSSESTGDDGVSVGDAVRVSKPNSLLMETVTDNTVTTLPGAIKSDGKTFDVELNGPGDRDPNTLPGAIGLVGSFDENDIPDLQGGSKDSGQSPVPTPKPPGLENPEPPNPPVPPLEPERKPYQTGSPKIKKDITMASKDSASPATVPAESSLAAKPAIPKRPMKKRRKKKRRKKKRKKKKKKKLSKTGNASAHSANSTSTSSAGKIPKSAVSAEQTLEKPRIAANAKLYEGPHPMNRKMEELQVAGETGKLEESAIRETYTKLVKAYLKPFEAGIIRRSFFEILRRKTYSLTPPGANKGVQTILFQIVSSKLYLLDPYEVSKNAKPFYRSRIKELIWLLSDVARDGKVPNTEFLLAIHDCVQTVSAEHTYRGAVYRENNPTFTIVSCNFSDNIPFPMWEGDEVRGGLKRWDEKMEQYKASDATPWAEKKEQAVFRGGNRPSMYFKNKKDADAHCDEVGRSRLTHVGKENPELFDVGVGGTCGGVSQMLPHLSEAGHHKYKYILYAEGNCFWADRLNKQVFGPSAIIKQETPCGQFWEPLLKPMTHYIPTDFFFMTTPNQIKWARQNDDKVQAIVKNANEFAGNFLSVKSVKLYVEVLLSEYSKLLAAKTIKPEKGSVEVTVT